MRGQQIELLLNADVPQEALDRTGLKVGDVQQYICHQSNQRIIESAVEKLKLPPDRVYVNIDRYGNTSAASIPICLDELYEAGRIEPGKPVVLVAFGLFSLLSGWRMRIDEQGALAAAGSAVGFAVGHASAQQVWRGIRSRPTWRVLCYSDEDPPLRRGLVLVDAVDGSVKEHFVEENLEKWDDPTT